MRCLRGALSPLMRGQVTEGNTTRAFLCDSYVHYILCHVPSSMEFKVDGSDQNLLKEKTF